MDTTGPVGGGVVPDPGCGRIGIGVCVSETPEPFLIESRVNFCVRCGTALEFKDMLGRLRPVCPDCGWVFFPDPKVAVAVVVIKNQQILLVRRINEPFQGKWSLPAGFMDAGEMADAAAERECLEETGLKIRINRFVDLVLGRSHANGADLLLVFSADVVSGELQAGDDADRASFYSLDALPPLAFGNLERVLDRLTK